MSEIITIEKVEEATSSKGPYKTVTYGGGKKASCFDGALLPLMTLGKTLEVTIEARTKGDKTYHNLTAAKPSEKPAEKPATIPTRAAGREPGERTSIERQTALKASVELAGYLIGKGKDFSAHDILQVAAGFAAFIASGQVPAKRTEPKISPAPPPSPAEPKTEKPAAQLPLNGQPPHDWNWFCKECLAAKIPISTAMNKLGIEKADQWKGTWDEALAKVKGGTQ